MEDFAAGDDREQHVAPRRGEDERGGRVVGGRQVRGAEAHGDEVCLQPFRERARYTLHVKRLRSAERHHAERVRGFDHAPAFASGFAAAFTSGFAPTFANVFAPAFERVARGARREQGEARFFEHVAGVVARHGIAPEADADARREHRRERRAAVAEFRVRLRAVRDARAVLGQKADVALVHAYAVREERTRFEDAGAREVADGRRARRVEREAAARVSLGEGAGAFEHEPLLGLALGGVNHQRQALVLREAREQLQELRRDGVRRVR